MGGGHPEPGRRARRAFHSGRHRARQRRHPRDAAGAGRRALGERVQQLVDVGAALLGARRLRAAELVAEPAVGAAREPAGVLQQPRLGIGVRMELDEPGRVVRRLGDHRADRLGRAHDVAHDARLDDARAERRGHLVARARARPASTPSRPVASRSQARIGPSTASGRAHRRQPRQVDAEGRARLRRPLARARIEQARRRARSRDRRRAPRRPPGHPRAGQQRTPRPRRDARARAARARRSSGATWPGSRLQPVSARSRSGSIRSAAAAHSSPARRSHQISAGCSGVAVAGGGHEPVELRAERQRDDLAPGGRLADPRQRGDERGRPLARGPARPIRPAGS